jgi:uncharacterized protein YaaR (DUF327 family)
VFLPGSSSCYTGKIKMSWVTDVLLIFSLEELYHEDGEELESIPALESTHGFKRVVREFLIT